MRTWIGCRRLGQNEECNGTSSTVKDREFLECICDFQLLNAPLLHGVDCNKQ